VTYRAAMTGSDARWRAALRACCGKIVMETFCWEMYIFVEMWV
jgi:hypothetical protein